MCRRCTRSNRCFRRSMQRPITYFTGGRLTVEIHSGIFPVFIEAMRVQTIGCSHPEAHVRSAPGTEGCGHGRDPGFARTPQRHIDGEVLRASGTQQSRVSGPAVAKKEDSLPKLLPKTDFAPFSDTENGKAEVSLTGSFKRCYVPE